MLRCVAVCCSSCLDVKHTPEPISCTAPCSASLPTCHTLPHHATHCTTHCNTLQHTRFPHTPIDSHTPLQHTATHGTTLQHTAAHCNTRHHTATHGTTLQHTVTHCNTLQHAIMMNAASFSEKQPAVSRSALHHAAELWCAQNCGAKWKVGT